VIADDPGRIALLVGRAEVVWLGLVLGVLWHPTSSTLITPALINREANLWRSMKNTSELEGGAVPLGELGCRFVRALEEVQE
jgi:hypothetical protein